MSDPQTPEPTIPPDIQARIDSLPEIPPQGIHPHFIINENLEVDRAPPAALDPEGNNIALLRQLLPRLAGIANAAVDLLGRGNRAHQTLLDRSSAYAAILRSDPAQLDRAGLYVEGLLLANALDATERAIAAPDGLPPLDVEARTMVQALLQLHAATILATREGQDAIANADRYQRTAEQEAALRADARAFAEQAQANSREQERVFTPAAAATLAATAAAAGQGLNPQRTAALSFAMVRNASVVVTAMTALCAVVGGISGSFVGLPLAGVGTGAAAGFGTVSYLLLAEGLKKWNLFARTAADIGHALDHAGNAVHLPDEPTFRRRIAAFARFTRAATPTLRRLANQGESFGWLTRTLDWVDRTNTTGRPTQVHHLTATGITTGAPTLGTPALGISLPQHEPEFEDDDFWEMSGVAPPEGFSIDEVKRRVLMHAPLPKSWLPFVRILNLPAEQSIRRQHHEDTREWFNRVYQIAKGRALTTLAPLAELRSLSSINVAGNPVRSLAPIVNLPNLRVLDVSDTLVDTVQLLVGVKKLTSLQLNRSQVRDIASLASLPNLKYLDLSGTRVTDLASLARLTALQSLDLTGTHVTNLSPLVSMSALQSLNISATPVTTLQHLCGLSDDQAFFLFRTATIPGSRLPVYGPFAQTDGSSRPNNLLHLSELNISRTEIEDLSPLLTLPALKSLDISRTKVRNLRFLSDIPTLLELNITGLPEDIEESLPAGHTIRMFR
jgi:hypothetical protein